MRLALFGYGKMGPIVEEAAGRAGAHVVCVIDPVTGSRGTLGDAEVCIDFSEPGAVMDNVRTAAEARLSMVVGTTGWYDQIDRVKELVNAAGIGFVYGSNFSIGVNLMFKIVERAADVFSKFSLYDPFIEEAHHKFKKDSPSGTAIFLRRILESRYRPEIPTASTRAGYLPGTHRVGFDSEADSLIISHTARSRAGFADGALVAAKWILGRKGFFEFSQIIDEQLEHE